MDIKFEGLDELVKALDKTGVDSEKKIRKHLNKQGRIFIEKAKENTPVGAKGKLKESYSSMNVKRNFKDYEKPIRNKSPYHHLVNNGHVQVDWKSGKSVGFVPGRFYIEETVAQTEDEFYQETEDFLEELFEELV